jgi:hypothetical protein
LFVCTGKHVVHVNEASLKFDFVFMRNNY